MKLVVATSLLFIQLSQAYLSVQNADIILGGLFPVHRNKDGSCGDILDFGFQRLEAMVLAVEMVNKDRSLLPGLTLGFDLRDTCTQPNVALQSSLDFIVGLEDGDNSTANLLVGVSGVVGSASSSESIAAASLLRLFATPQISYASTARILSDKTRYEYFLRTLPPDLYQARVMVELVMHYNWTYVVTINSDDVYGREGIGAFIDELKMATAAPVQNTNVTANSSTMPPPIVNFCTVGNIEISTTASFEVYDDAIDQINREWIANSSVVVVFGQLRTMEELLKALVRRGNHRRLTFVVSDAVGNNLHHEYYSNDHSIIAVVPEYTQSDEFDRYFTSLKPSSTDNPWFAEYWESMFSCTFNTSDKASKQYCNESTQSLASNPKYHQNSKVPFVLDAVYAFAHAIHNMLEMVCGEITLCENAMVERYGRKVINGKILLRYLKNVTFTGFSNDRIKFDENGDQAGGYWINQLQQISNVYNFARIAEWNAQTSFVRTSSPVYWGVNHTGSIPVSQCSPDCYDGYYPQLVPGHAVCCFMCDLCDGERQISSMSECVSCARGFSPNANRSSCEENPLVYLRWTDALAILILFVDFVGVFATGIVITIMIIFAKHQVVKASSRELSSVILVSILLSLVIVFFSIGRPIPATCTISRFLFGFSFSLCYAALLVKVNRMHRIFNRNMSSSQRPPLISPQSQLFFTFLLVSVQVVISGAWLVVEPPGTKLIYHDYETEITCNGTPYVGIIVSLIYNMALMVAIVYFSYRTRKIPQNFNEAKFIYYSVYGIGIIWFVFIIVYFSISGSLAIADKYITVMQLFGIIFSAISTLGCLFFVKIYFIFSAKRKAGSSSEKNNGIDYHSSNTMDRKGSMKLECCHGGIQQYKQGSSREIKAILSPKDIAASPNTFPAFNSVSACNTPNSKTECGEIRFSDINNNNKTLPTV